jgi:hypothetical protein
MLLPGGECYALTTQKPVNIIKKTLEDPPEEFGDQIIFTNFKRAKNLLLIYTNIN